MSNFLTHKLTILFIVLTSLVKTTAHGNNEGYVETINLFDGNGVPRYSVEYTLPSDNHSGLYQDFLIDGKRVPPGTELVLETGEKFTFRQLLGFGMHTIVIRDMENRAIRLAQHIDARTMNMNEQYSEAYFHLRTVVDAKYLVNMSEKQFRSIYTTVVEMIGIEVTLDKYLEQGINPSDPRYTELLEFFVGFKRVRSLGGDFLPEQIGYVPKRGWVLFDYSPGVRILAPGDKSNAAVNLLTNWPRYIEERFIEIETLEQLEKDIRRQQMNEVLQLQNGVRSCRQIFTLPF